LDGWTRIIDLTHTVTEAIPGWPDDPDLFEVQVHARLESEGYFTRSFRSMEHFGTHLDAPAHFALGRPTVDLIPAERLCGPAVVLEGRAEVERNPDYVLPPEKVEQWEHEHGRIPAGAIVLFRTGWASRWPDVARYYNRDAAGVMHTPGFSPEAVRLLIERVASGIGVDSISVDPGNSSDYPVHCLALSAGLYQLENLADLSALPGKGALLVVAPLKLKGGSGAPCRVFALLW
jgi:kynurenine formamidase